MLIQMQMGCPVCPYHILHWQRGHSKIASSTLPRSRWCQFPFAGTESQPHWSSVRAGPTVPPERMAWASNWTTPTFLAEALGANRGRRLCAVGFCMVVPSKLQPKVLSMLHESHVGIVFAWKPLLGAMCGGWGWIGTLRRWSRPVWSAKLSTAHQPRHRYTHGSGQQSLGNESISIMLDLSRDACFYWSWMLTPRGPRWGNWGPLLQTRRLMFLGNFSVF